MITKIAVDRQVGKKVIRELDLLDIQTVYMAQTHDSDEFWVEAGRDYGATVFVSPDIDVSCICNRDNLRYVRIPGSLPKKMNLTTYIYNKISKGRFD